MKRINHLCLCIAASLLLTAALVLLGLHVENTRTRRRADSLLDAVRQLRVGESTLANTQNLLTDFGASKWVLSPVPGSPPKQRYGILIANIALCKLELKLPSLWRFGLRPAWVEAEFNYKEEILTSVTYKLHSPVFTTSSGEPVELVAVALLGEESDLEPNRSFNVFYRLRPSFMVPRALQLN